MGISPFKISTCSCGACSSCRLIDTEYVYVDRFVDQNPDPENFQIKNTFIVKGKCQVFLVDYPDCTNYEGRKIIVVGDSEEGESYMHGEIDFLDPHFCENAEFPVLARFEPTERGWNWAIKFALSL